MDVLCGICCQCVCAVHAPGCKFRKVGSGLEKWHFTARAPIERCPRSTAILPQSSQSSLNYDVVFLIGSGKSLLLRAIISALKKKYSKNTSVVSITASTGMAASNIGGGTSSDIVYESE